MATQLSNRIQRVKPSPTLAVTALAQQLRAEGRDVIGLAAGEPDFTTPEHVKQAAIDAINNNFTGYTAVDGTPSLKQAIINKFEKDNGLSYAPDQILVSCGGKQSFFNMAQAMLNPGDEVIIPAPYWVSYPDMVMLADAEPVIVEGDQSQGFKITAEQLKAAITDKTRVIFIANPNNPTGTWLGKKELFSFLEKMPENVLVVLDEAYFDFASDDLSAKDYPNGIEWIKQFPNLIVTRTFSKAYGLAGLRVGYSVSDLQVADALNRVRQPFNVNSLALKAAEVALADVDYLEAGLKLNTQGMRQLISAFDKMALSYIPSVGNFICVNVGENAMKVYDDLLYEGVIVRPVANYEMPEYLRITIGTKKENDRFITALKKVLNK